MTGGSIYTRNATVGAEGASGKLWKQPSGVDGDSPSYRDGFEAIVSRRFDHVRRKDDDRKSFRAKALRYYRGECDVPYEDGMNSIVSRDIPGMVNMLVAQVQRILMGGDVVVKLSPRKSGQVAWVRDAMKAVNQVLTVDNEGWTELRNALLDAALYRNGFIKVWTEELYENEDETLEKASDLEIRARIQELEAEGAEVEEGERERSEDVPVEMQPDPDNPPSVFDMESGEEIEVGVLYDVTLSITRKTQTIRIDSMPRDECLIDFEAKRITDHTCRLFGQRQEKTVGELVAEGFDKESVDRIPEFSTREYERLERFQAGINQHEPDGDPMAKRVQMVEVWTYVDMDDDGIPELYHTFFAGEHDRAYLELTRDGKPAREKVSNMDICNIQLIPQANRWEGRSLVEELYDIQDAKTHTLRKGLDRQSWELDPERVARADLLEEPERLGQKTYGQTHFASMGAASVQDVIAELPVQPAATPAIAWLQYLDSQAELRTGISMASPSAAADSLQNQTATATMSIETMSSLRPEDMAAAAAVGVADMGKMVLRHLVRNGETMEIPTGESQFKEVDPKEWETGVKVTAGMGTWNRDRDIAMLSQIAQLQQGLIGTLGPDNPIAGLPQLANTLSALPIAAGLPGAENHIKLPTDEELAQWRAAKAQAAAQQPDPAQQAAQVEMAKAQAKAQADMQAKVAQSQADLQIAAMEAEAKRQQEIAELQHKQQVEAAKLALDRAMTVREQDIKEGLRRREQNIEQALAIRGQNMDAATSTNIPRA